MAKVHAAKALETMLDQTYERTGIGRAATQQRVPGLQIVNSASPVGGQTPAKMIEATPESKSRRCRLKMIATRNFP